MRSRRPGRSGCWQRPGRDREGASARAEAARAAETAPAETLAAGAAGTRRRIVDPPPRGAALSPGLPAERRESSDRRRGCSPRSTGGWRRCARRVRTCRRLTRWRCRASPGTVIEDRLNYDVSRWLLKRFPGRVDVAWDGYDKQTRLGETLPRFLPLLDDDAYVEADVPYLRWLRSARGGAGRDLAWLVSRFERLPRSERERAELFDSLELTVRWDLDNLRASRTRNWRSVRRVFYHPGPFIRRGEVDLVKEMRAPLRVERLSRRDGEKALDLMREIMTVRRRELWGTTYGDPGIRSPGRRGAGIGRSTSGGCRRHAVCRSGPTSRASASRTGFRSTTSRPSVCSSGWRSASTRSTRSATASRPGITPRRSGCSTRSWA